MFRSNNHSDPLIRVFVAAGQLKNRTRAGWVRVGISDPESVADHSYRLAVMALLIGPRLGLNPEVMVRLALLHDLAEAEAGDITPSDGISRMQKREREAAALSRIIQGLPEGPAIFDTWEMYERSATREARVIHELDKLEMAQQALEYEHQQGRNLDEFWKSARAALHEPLLVELFDRLYQARPSL